MNLELFCESLSTLFLPLKITVATRAFSPDSLFSLSCKNEIRLKLYNAYLLKNTAG